MRFRNLLPLLLLCACDDEAEPIAPEEDAAPRRVIAHDAAGAPDLNFLDGTLPDAAPPDVRRPDAALDPRCGECAIGDVRCDDERHFEACAEFAAGCVRYSDPVACPGDAVCSDGACSTPCLDVCDSPGERTCDPDGRILECRRGANGCLTRVEAASCPPGARDCNDADSYRVCAADADGCFGWRVSPCVEDVSCLANPAACLGGCPPACELGALRCGDGATYVVCEEQAGCPTEVVRRCAAGNDCASQRAACLGQCPPTCELGLARCLDGAAYEACEPGPDGCPAWVRHPCESPGDCADDPNECVGGCQDVCVEGGRGCAAEGWRECVRGDNGCTRWESHACVEEGLSCFQAPDACMGACENACDDGARECTERGYRACERGFDGCLSWTDRFCFNGGPCADAPAACFGECEGFGCDPGEKRCLGGDRFEVCVATEEGCTEWQERPCADGADCFGSRRACFGECEGVCEPDARECTEDGWRRCERDFEGCTVWRDRFCANGGPCADAPAACFGECEGFPCNVGDKRCSGADAFEECVGTEEGCTEWRASPCVVAGSSCFNGRDACFGDCADACVEDARECVDGPNWRECFRGFDGCTEWIDRGCFGGQATCADSPNACFGDCFDNCDPGEARCWDGSSFQVCERGEEGCLGWADPQPCAAEANCFGDQDACFGR